uniref:EF-hand domain-containing protein n=1 Tax=Scophthalmus maximus TaxID=52904 RepID=A0A8D3B317_SCOMX
IGLCSCLLFERSIRVFFLFSCRTLANPAAADQLMSSLDKNNDGELHFLESWQMIGHLACKRGGFSQ